MADVVIVSESGTVTVVADTETVTVFDGTGTVYGVSIVSANGFAGSVAKDTTTPQITLSTSINGLVAGDGTSIFAATAGTGLSYDDITGILTNSEPDQTVTLTDGTDITVTGTYPSFTISYSGAGGAGGAYLPLAGGTMTGAIVFGTGSQYISKGNFDTSRGGSSGISLVCSVGYEFNWQAGWLITTADGTTTPRPLYLDSLAGTTLRAWNSSTSTGTEVDHLGITFSDATVQTTAYTGGAGVSSLTAGAGISLDVTTGDITVTNSEPDQTVVLTDGAGITITGTYPSFTIDCDITQYADTDARLALSAGTGITYDNTTGIITNDNPDQTVTLTDGAGITVTGTYPSFTIAYSGAVGGVSSLTAGTGISLDVTTGDITVTNSEPDQTVTLTDGTGITVTGTYPSFTVDCDVTQYTDTDARLAISAGTGITYDNATGIITNDNPDQTVVLTDGTDITVTGTYPSFTISYSGAGGGSGTVTSASVVSANGFAGTVATDTTTPAITITTTVTGILIGDGTAIAAATAGTDYVIPSGSITGSAASLSATLDVTSGGTGLATLTAENVILGNGTSSPTFVAPSTSGNVLTSNGTTWQSTAPVGGGTVTSASVVSANGFGGSVATDTTTPAITISTSITGLLIGNGTAISAATAGTDYVAPSGALGTPSSGTLTSCTGLPISTGVSGLGTSVAAFLATPSSANLKTAITDETGTGGSLVFATSPALTTPTITGLIETKTAPTISAGALALNCALGNVFHVSLNAAVTSLTFSNIPASGSAFGLTLILAMTGTAYTITWPASVKWPSGTAPTLTSTNLKSDIIILTTVDGGTTWFAFIGGQNF